LPKETLLEKVLRLRRLREENARQPPPMSRSVFLRMTDELEFGKHKGATVEKMLEVDPGWIRWAVENIPGLELADDVWVELRYQEDPRRPLLKE